MAGEGFVTDLYEFLLVGVSCELELCNLNPVANPKDVIASLQGCGMHHMRKNSEVQSLVLGMYSS